jgi:hypothetical protein
MNSSGDAQRVKFPQRTLPIHQLFQQRSAREGDPTTLTRSRCDTQAARSASVRPFEGAIPTGYPTDAADQAVLENVQAAGYGR